MMILNCCSTVCLLLFIVASARGDKDVYKQIYPPVNDSLLNSQDYCDPDSNQTCPLFIVFLSSFGGLYKSNGGIPGVQIALDEINRDSSMLPGYSLHYALKDSNCSRQVALSSFYTQMFQPPTKLGVIGSGCSVATEATAEVAYYFNLTQISCVSSSPALSDRDRYKSYFQMLSSEVFLAYGYFGIIQQFRWKNVAIIVQDETLFTKVMDLLTEQLRAHELNYTEIKFATSQGVNSINDRLFNPEARIFILSMYPSQATEVICKASQKKMYYPRYQFIMPGWYSERWWVGDNATQRNMMQKYQCSLADRERVLVYSLTVVLDEFLKNYSKVADSGTNGERFYKEYDLLIATSDPSFNLEPTVYAQQCYDATWTYARALNKTLMALIENDTITELLGKYNSALQLNPGGRFRLQDFTYNNSAMLDLMLEKIEETNFVGITDRVQFNNRRVKRVDFTLVGQYRRNSTSRYLELVNVASINFSNTDDITFSYRGGLNDNSLWPGPVPYDGVPREVIVTIHPAVTVIFILLSFSGIVFASCCFIFNFKNRNMKLIRLASSKLNYIIAIGAIILYINIIFIVVPSTDPIVVSVFCNLNPWLTAIGYSLCYGTILAKMVRVYYIFNNPSMKRRGFHDRTLILGVFSLVAIDITILIIFTAVEGSQGKLSPLLHSSLERPRSEEGEMGIITKYSIYLCDSMTRDIKLGVLYGYKMVLQIIALVLAFSIRKVKIKGLNDAKYIGAAIYVTSIVLAVIIVSTYTLRSYINGFPALFSIGFILGTTAILILVFVPLMVGLHKDPKGKTIFEKTRTDISNFIPKSMSGENPDENMETLKNRIAELENKLKILEKQTGNENENGNKENGDKENGDIVNGEWKRGN